MEDEVKPGPGPGADPLGVRGLIAVGAYYAVLAWFVLYSLITLWPPPSTPPSPPPAGSQASGMQQAAAMADAAKKDDAEKLTAEKAKADAGIVTTMYFRQPVDLSGPQRLMYLVLLSGALGGLLHGLRSFFWYVGNRWFIKSWLAMYLMVPILGAATAAVFYLVLIGGLFSTSGIQSGTNPAGFMAVGTLVGLFSQQAVLKLKDIAETMFTKPPAGANAVSPQVPPKPSAPPRIDEIAPSTVAPGKQTLTLTGSNFDASTKVNVVDAAGTATALAPSDVQLVSSTSLKFQATLAAGHTTISVTSGSGVHSNTLIVKVDAAAPSTAGVVVGGSESPRSS
jgi:hypothetical protein